MYVGIAVVLGILLVLLITKKEKADQTLVTATVETGDVTNAISVSGFIEAKNTAQLAFPTTGIVTDVLVAEGDTVAVGDILATQAATELVAKRTQAVAALNGATAALAEVTTGPTAEARAVTAATLRNAADTLDQVEAEQAEKVATAYSTLLSSNLEARSLNSDERATPPTITGSYTCAEEGMYTITVYRSGALSGYSYAVTGLEDLVETAYTDQPGTLGTCGLYLQFTDGDQYSGSEWTIDVPNTAGASYVANKNAYDQALINQTNAIAAADNNLTLAEEESALANATARTEVVTQKRAAVTEAQARVNEIDAAISDRSIVAAFAGTITDVDILPGETAGAEPVITLLATDTFELTARIPEIDINKLQVDQVAEVVFDAADNTTLTGIVTYISPLATEIDGVAYFETTITLDEEPAWIRSGLNADIDIITAASTDTLRIPRRFLYTQPDGSYVVRTQTDGTIASTTVEVLLLGNDGYVSISGLPEGAVVVQ